MAASAEGDGQRTPCLETAARPQNASGSRPGRRRLVAVNDGVFLLSDDENCEEDPHDWARRSAFAASYLSRQAWIRPSRYDVKASMLSAGRRVSVDDVLVALRRIPSKHWLNTGRANVRPRGVDAIDSITLGLVSCASTQGMPLPSQKTCMYPNLCRMLLRFWKQNVKADASSRSSCSNLICTSIQLNRNYAAREHVDGNNLGPSWLIAAGDWTSGGQLFVEDPAGCEEHEVSSDVWAHNSWRYRSGEHCRGTSLDVHNRWVRFDGRRMHFVHSFTGGDRFSLVFFAVARHAVAPQAARSFLSVLGFPIPLTCGSTAAPLMKAGYVEHQGDCGKSVVKLDSQGRAIMVAPSPSFTRDDLEIWLGAPLERTSSGPGTCGDIQESLSKTRIGAGSDEGKQETCRKPKRKRADD